MIPQKNNDLKYCIKCLILLTNENWPKYLQLPKRSNYICTSCYKEYSKNYHKSDPLYSDKQLARTRFRKSAVIFAYGNICNICNEDEYEKLTIDHVNNNGAKHRKELKSNIYEWLYNNPIYDGYQVLCYNCNCSKNVIYKDKYALRDKKIVMEHYGNQCQECSESRIERLTIDHINNDGAEQRKKLKYSTGVKMYRWLIKNKFPDLRLQILCFNCNCSKRSKNNKIINII